MPDPDDDVELPPSYDFTGGFGSFLTDPQQRDPGDPAATDPADPADPPGGATPPPPPTQPATPPPPPVRQRGWRGPTGPSAYGTPPSASGAISRDPQPAAASAGAKAPTTPPRPARKPRKKAKRRTPTAARGSGSNPRQGSSSTPATAPPTRTGWTPWRLAGTAAAVVTVAVVVGVNATGDGAGSDPQSTTVPVEPDTSSVLWTYGLDRDARLMRDDLSGASALATGLGSAIAVGDRLLGRFSADPNDEDGPAKIRVVDLVDGAARDLLTLERPRCAAVPGALGRGSDLVACSGVDDSSPVIVTLNVATGEEVRRWPVSAPIELIAVTADGVVTLDAVDPEVGSTALRWYGPDGAPRWTVPSADLPGSVREQLLQQRDEGWELLYSAVLAPVGDGALLSGSQAVVSMDATGVTLATACWAGSVVGDVFTCDNEGTREAEGRTASGELLWSDEDLSLGLGYLRRAPVTLASDYVSLEEDYRVDNRLVDARTGRTGPVLPEIEGSPRVDGPVGSPVAIVEEDREDYDETTVATVSLLDPVTLGVTWSVELPSRQYSNVVVTDRRVLVEVDRRRWTVLDLADGSVVGGLATDSDVVAIVDGGIITSGFDAMQRVELP
ncbi:hypothetical protein [Serinibacter arcticus]|uniref:Uncharacterized protein n=1 Tax=Serinibacter arcticus TaxID=1655435 RepID=A0A4Z1E7M1_9MICO|nr:hypothetical protein [Serinibacter arcticus]TGO06728.1 hypothetical protein SERN_0920 [Serinibacter arcticus]